MGLVFNVSLLVLIYWFLTRLRFFFLSSSSSIESREYFFSFVAVPYPELIEDFLEEWFDAVPTPGFNVNDPLLLTEGRGIIDFVFPVINDFFIFIAKSSGTSSSLRFLNNIIR